MFSRVAFSFVRTKEDRPASVSIDQEMEMVRYWADLPRELINMIASRATLEIDRLRLVCKSWKDAVASHWAPTCLMNYCQPTKTWQFHREDGHCSLFTDVVVGVSYPQLKDADIRCSKFGWLLMSRKNCNSDGCRYTLFFYNPHSNQTVTLPHPLPGAGYSTLFFTHPPTSPRCTVVGIFRHPWPPHSVQTCVLARGQEWDIKEHTIKTEFIRLSNGPPIVHRGQIYFTDVLGNVARFDINNRRLVTAVKCLTKSRKDDEQIIGRQEGQEMKEQYLFKLNGDRESLFGVFVFRVNKADVVKVFRLSQKKMKWRMVDDIGDNAVFLSSISTLSFPCKKSMANRIYFPRLCAHGCLVFYSLSDAKFHSHRDSKNVNSLFGTKKLDHAAWIRTSYYCTPTQELTRPVCPAPPTAWKK